LISSPGDIVYSTSRNAFFFSNLTTNTIQVVDATTKQLKFAIGLPDKSENQASPPSDIDGLLK